MPALAVLLTKFCQSLGVRGNVALLEMMSVPPEQALKMLSGMRNQVLSWHERKLPFKDFMRWFASIGSNGKSVLTGSCGQTSGWLDDITTPGGKAPPQDVLPAAQALERLGQITARRWYARVSSGSHSFLIEYDGASYAIYQSFFGSQSIQFSIENLLAGKFVFADRGRFFELLESALLDSETLMRSGTARLQREAERYAQQRGAPFGPGAFDKLVEARVKMDLRNPPESAKKLIDEAPKAQIEALEIYDIAYDELDDRAVNSGKSQALICHGSMWATSAEVQLRINTAPADEQETTKTLQILISGTETAWESCFHDSETPMERHLVQFGVLDGVGVLAASEREMLASRPKPPGRGPRRLHPG